MWLGVHSVHRGTTTLSLTTVGKTTQHKLKNATQYKIMQNVIMLKVIMSSGIMLSVIPQFLHFALATGATNAVSLGVWYWPMGGWI